MRKSLPCDPHTVRYAVGFGCDPNPDHALTFALCALELDPQLVETRLQEPTCAPPPDLTSALAALVSQPAMSAALSPPRFKLKA